MSILHTDKWKHRMETDQKSGYWNTMFPKMINNGKITSERFNAEMHPHESLDFSFNKIQLKPNKGIAVKPF